MNSRKVLHVFMLVCLTAGWMALGKGTEIRLEARLSADAAAGDVSGKAKFRQRFERDRQRRQFSVQVEGFEPGQIFDVMIAGTVIGRVVIDDFGIGNLDYDDNFEPGVDDPATQFPSNFPALDGGERVEIGILGGNMQSR